MDNKKPVFLFQSHILSRKTLGEFKKIRKAAEGMGDAWFLYHARSEGTPKPLRKCNAHIFTDESLNSLGYPRIGTPLIPGHAHFPLLQFRLAHPEYSNYWVIEYDVRYSGKWSAFFRFFSENSADFLTCNIRTQSEEPGWHWWKLEHPSASIPLASRLRSFNTIYRLSPRAIDFLHQSHLNGWRGHHEVFIPTLLFQNGFSVTEIGGNGSFTPIENHDRFYPGTHNDRAGRIGSGTMRYRPAFWKTGRRKDSLYHPVKPLSFVLRETEKTLPDRIKRLKKKIRSKLRRLRNRIIV